MNTAAIYTGLQYSTSEINMNFRIKAHTTSKKGIKMNTLLGVAGLIRLVGVEMANKFIGKCFESTDDKCTCKLRSGVRVTFYAK